MTLLDPELNLAPSTIGHIHIMGICGTGMAALAGMLQQSGYTISGSDNAVYPPMSDFLKQLGITVAEGYSGENLTPAPDLVIVGNVITSKNPEAIQLGNTDIPYLSFPQALAHFFIAKHNSLVVAGTHGKTTTCALLATALHRSCLDPTFMIGGILPEFGGNFRLGEGEYFVAEGDEYDTAFFDKGSKFLHYQPRIGIITSLEFDHADIFADLEAIKASFRSFVALFPRDGLIIANLDDPNVAEVVSEAHCPVQGYGLQQQREWCLEKFTTRDGLTTFTANHDGKTFGELAIRLPGRHNCLNGLAVTALLHHIGLSRDEINQGLETFGGVKRRQEVRGIENGVTVIDDFAHHPTAVRETITALKEAYGVQRLVVVFEPRTNTSRRAIFQQEYVSAFDQGDLIVIREPVPLANCAPEDHFSSAKLVAALRDTRKLDAHALPTTDAILDFLAGNLVSGDVVAILSNGGFDNIHTRLLDQLKLGNLARSNGQSE